MPLDVRDVFALTTEVDGALGVLLLLFWLQNLREPALAWWGWGRIVRAFAISVYVRFDSTPHWLMIDAANVLLFASYALTWCGVREFSGREPFIVPLVTGATLWLSVSLASVVFGTLAAHSLISAAFVAAFLWLSAFELVRGRSMRLRLRWPAALILFGNGSVFLLEAPSIGWVGTYHLFLGMTLLSTWTLVAGICTTFVLVGMIMERAESRRMEAIASASAGIEARPEA